MAMGPWSKPNRRAATTFDEYFNMAAASYGFQAGVQLFGYVLVLISDAAVEHV